MKTESLTLADYDALVARNLAHAADGGNGAALAAANHAMLMRLRPLVAAAQDYDKMEAAWFALDRNAVGAILHQSSKQFVAAELALHAAALKVIDGRR